MAATVNIALIFRLSKIVISISHTGSIQKIHNNKATTNPLNMFKDDSRNDCNLVYFILLLYYTLIKK